MSENYGVISYGAGDKVVISLVMALNPQGAADYKAKISRRVLGVTKHPLTINGLDTGGRNILVVDNGQVTSRWWKHPRTGLKRGRHER